MESAAAGAGLAARRRRAGRLTRWVPVAAAVAAKAKLLLVLGSALLSIVVYAVGFGWPLAVGFVALLAVHELGHVAAMRLKGFPASAPYFVPLLGAVIFARRVPRDAAEDAFIGAGGPVTGVLGSWIALGLYAATRREVFLALATLGFLVHLFNLVPVTPLDGGRILAFLRWWVWVPAFLVLLVVFTYDARTHAVVPPGPVGTVILVMVLAHLVGEWRRERRHQRPPVGLGLGARFACAGVWLALAAATVAGLGVALGGAPGVRTALGV